MRAESRKILNLFLHIRQFESLFRTLQTETDSQNRPQVKPEIDVVKVGQEYMDPLW
jgi:HSP20 family molecular chaperone IbpA